MSIYSKIFGGTVLGPALKAGVEYIEQNGLTSRAIEKTKQISVIAASTWRPAIARSLGKSVVFCLAFTAFMVAYCLIAISLGKEWVSFKEDSALLGLWLRWELMTGLFFDFALWFLGGYAALREAGKGRDSIVAKAARKLSAPKDERKPLQERAEPMQAIPGVMYRPEIKLDKAQLAKEIYKEESNVLHIYEDSLGFRTAGVGHLLKPEDREYDQPLNTPISEKRSREWFKQDISIAISDARHLVSGYDDMPHEAKLVIANMSFQLGRDKLSRFVKTIALLEQWKWSEAAEEALDSKWAEQTPARAVRMARRLKALDNNEMDLELS